jgi:hypothetical protein
MCRRVDLPPAEPEPSAALIPPGSVYARLAEYRDRWVPDEDCAPF